LAKKDAGFDKFQAEVEVYLKKKLDNHGTQFVFVSTLLVKISADMKQWLKKMDLTLAHFLEMSKSLIVLRDKGAAQKAMRMSLPPLHWFDSIRPSPQNLI